MATEVFTSERILGLGFILKPPSGRGRLRGLGREWLKQADHVLIVVEAGGAFHQGIIIVLCVYLFENFDNNIKF